MQILTFALRSKDGVGQHKTEGGWKRHIFDTEDCCQHRFLITMNTVFPYPQSCKIVICTGFETALANNLDDRGAHRVTHKWVVLHRPYFSPLSLLKSSSQVIIALIISHNKQKLQISNTGKSGHAGLSCKHPLVCSEAFEKMCVVVLISLSHISQPHRMQRLSINHCRIRDSPKYYNRVLR